jgi:predicted ATPase
VSQSNYPLKQWRLGNFKSVERAEVNLTPLTILVGANSSGKTTLIQSILLFAQASRSARGESVIPLNGSLLGLGDFKNVLHIGAESGEITCGGTFSLLDPAVAARLRRTTNLPMRGGHSEWGGEYFEDLPETEAQWDVTLSSETTEHPGTASLKAVRLSRVAQPSKGQGLLPFSETYQAERRNDEPKPVYWIPGASPFLAARGARTDYLPFSGRLDREDAARSITTVGLVHKAGLPQAIATETDGSQIAVATFVFDYLPEVAASDEEFRHRRPQFTRMRRNIWAMQSWRDQALAPDSSRQSESIPQELFGWLDGAAGIIRKAGPGLQRRGPEQADIVRSLSSQLSPAQRQYLLSLMGSPGGPEMLASVLYARVGEGAIVWQPEPEFDELQEASSAMLWFFSERVQYLGPLRQEPQVMYRLSQSERYDVIGTRGEHTAAVLHTFGTKLVLCPQVDGTARNKSLIDAVNYWLNQFGLAKAVSTTDQGRLGLELTIEPDGMSAKLDMTRVGVGVSQVLPVLVMALLADPGSLLLIEQAELHLHPAMQQKLGDFLLACARSGRQLIVETHSDHLVTRLRRSIAEDPTDDVLRIVSFVFAEHENGATRYTPVPATRYGSLQAWPAGFFDQTAKESQDLLRAGLKKMQGNQ